MTQANEVLSWKLTIREVVIVIGPMLAMFLTFSAGWFSLKYDVDQLKSQNVETRQLIQAEKLERKEGIRDLKQFIKEFRQEVKEDNRRIQRKIERNHRK